MACKQINRTILDKFKPQNGTYNLKSIEVISLHSVE